MTLMRFIAIQYFNRLTALICTFFSSLVLLFPLLLGALLLAQSLLQRRTPGLALSQPLLHHGPLGAALLRGLQLRRQALCFLLQDPFFCLPGLLQIEGLFSLIG